MGKTVFYLPKQLTLDRALAIYTEQELRKSESKNPSHIDPALTDFSKVGADTKSLDVLISSLPRGTTIVLWSMEEMTIPVARLRAILEKRKADYLTIRILDPEYLIDPSTPESESFLRILESVQKTHKEEAKPKPEYLAARLNPGGFGFRRVPDHVIAMMRQDKLDGLSIEALCKKYGYAKATVCKYTKGIREIKKEPERITREVSPEHSFDYDRFLDELRVSGKRARTITLEFLKSQRTYSTKKIYAEDILRFVSWYDVRTGRELADISNIDYKAALDYKDYLLENFDKVSVIRRYFISVRTLLSYCKKRGYIELNNFSTIKLPAQNRHRVTTDPLSDEELKRVLEIAYSLINETKDPDRRMIRYRNFLAVWILANTGLRIDGVRALRKKDIIVRRGETLMVVRHKGGEEDEIAIDLKTAKLINGYLDTYFVLDPDNAYLMFKDGLNKSIPLSGSAIYSAIKKIFQKANVDPKKKITSHSFRVTFTTASYKSGVPVKTIQHKLGHKRIDQTYAYIKLVDQKAENAWLPELDISMEALTDG